MLGIFLDIEANGLNPRKHEILQMAFQFVDLLSGSKVASYESVLFQTKENWEKSDPASLRVNGFTYEEVLSGQPKEKVKEEVCSLFDRHGIHRKKAVYICQNPSFDRAFFSRLIEPEEQERRQWPYHWLDLASMYWALRWQSFRNGLTSPPWETGISKNNIARVLGLPEEASPHRAMQGVEHLVRCYFALNVSAES